MSRLKKEIRAAAVGEMKETEPGTVSRPYRFAPDFIGFSGHFPGSPILPAIVQLLAALTLAEERKGCVLEVATVESAKFLTPLHPDQEITVQCRQVQVNGKPTCRASLTAAGSLASFFSLTFTAEDGV